MQTPRKPLLVNAIWAIGGLSLGACVATVLDGRWTAEWVAATGTWFGAIATVLALLWAVASFRADQSDRDKTRVEERAKETAIERARALRELTEASNVTVSITGAGGYGTQPDNYTITSLAVVITNTSMHDALVTSWWLGDEAKPKQLLESNISLGMGKTHSMAVPVEPTPSPEGLGAAPIGRFSAEMNFRLDGLDWHRSNTGIPDRL